MNVLLVFGHPRQDSLGGARYQAFRAGLTAASIPHRERILADLDFDPEVPLRVARASSSTGS